MDQMDDGLWKTFMKVPRHFFSAIDRAMLTAGTPESNIQRREPAGDIALRGPVYKLPGGIKKYEHLSPLFKKVNHRFVATGECLILGISTSIMHRASIKHISSAVGSQILRIPFFIGEAHHTDMQTSVIKFLRSETLERTECATGLTEFRIARHQL